MLKYCLSCLKNQHEHVPEIVAYESVQAHVTTQMVMRATILGTLCSLLGSALIPESSQFQT